MSTTTASRPLSSRPYDLVLFGATGYTGKYCAEHITTHLPSNLSWAVAGRSASKLRSVVEEIKSLNPDRKQPVIEECALEDAPLAALAQKTKVLVNCVGPYALYGEVVLRACVESGTGYVDTTGEIPWVLKMVRKYHERARQTGAIIIPQCGFESCASDLLTYHTLSTYRNRFSSPATSTTTTVHSIRGSVSGGTLLTIFTALDTFPLRDLLESTKPWVLLASLPSTNAPPPPRPDPNPRSWLSSLTGTHFHPALGPLTQFPMAGANAAIVQRSWGLLSKPTSASAASTTVEVSKAQASVPAYGPSFTYSEWLSVRSRLLGLAFNLALGTTVLLLALPPVRWILKQIVTAPGSGPSREAAAKEGFEFRCVAEGGKEGERVMGSMAWRGGIYQVTAVYMVQAAATVLGLGSEGRGTPAHGLGGGVLTPACLGEGFVGRLREGGVRLEAEVI